MNAYREALIHAFLAQTYEAIQAWTPQQRYAFLAFVTSDCPASVLGLRGEAAREFAENWRKSTAPPPAPGSIHVDDERPRFPTPDPAPVVSPEALQKLVAFIRRFGPDEGERLWREWGYDGGTDATGKVDD